VKRSPGDARSTSTRERRFETDSKLDFGQF
jgi:hypothetical protein